MKKLTIGLFFLMLVLHQDFWFWQDERLLFGFVPVAVAYHGVFSILCSALGWMAFHHLWPHEAERHSEEPNS